MSATRVLCVSSPRVHLPRPHLCLPRLLFCLPDPRSCLPLLRMSTSGGSWVCPECGKVCKSRGGLTQHSAVHKRHPRVREFDDNSTRSYHPNLDGRSEFLLHFAGSNLPKENHANQMENSFLPTPRLFPHSQSPTTIGLRLNRVLDSNLRKSYITRPLSRTASLTSFSVYGVLH